MSRNGAEALEDAVVEPSGWFSVQLRYGYREAGQERPSLIEDRVVLIDGDDEEAALAIAVEIAPQYEDEFETDDGGAGEIRFEGIVAIKELDDPPSAGTEVWHEFMSPDPDAPRENGERLPPVWPTEMAFPRGSDD